MASGIPIFYSEVKQNKKLLFGLMGFVSGVVGALIDDAVFFFIPDKQPYVIGIFTMAIWAGIFSAVIAAGLYWAIDIYAHKKTDVLGLLKKGIPAGFFAGAISGAISQAIYGQFSDSLSEFWSHFLFQAACWGVAGLILGWILARSIPNLGSARALIAGALGGFIGGAGFLLVGSVFVDTIGRMIGVGILGAALGLCLVIVEEMSRVAYVEVHWTPDEVSLFTLGSTPIFIGAGDSTIMVPTVPPHAMSLVIEGGEIIGIDHTKGKKKQLVDGNHIQIGKIDMIIRTGMGKMRSQ